MDEHQVIAQMLAAGLDAPPLPLNVEGRRTYFGPKKKQWYRLSRFRTRAGTDVVVGAFGNYKTGERHKVEIDWRGISEEEAADLKARREQQAAAAKAQRAAESARAAMTAAELWHEGSKTGRSAYLERKGVQAEACRFLHDGSILVPLLRYDLPRDQALRAVQRIWPDGTKRFTAGFEKPRCALRLGLVTVGDPVLVCEGYATGLTLRMAVGQRMPVFVALDAGNLLPVVEMLRELHPQCPILICADDDWRTKGNPGRTKAWAAARAVARCIVTYPVFRWGARAQKDTDFNDLHAREGLEMVLRQLRMVLPVLGYQPAPMPRIEDARVA
jgi:putative DNA primase/helicase